MSINIMDLVKGAVTDQVLGQLGGLLGQSDQNKTSSLFESAAASILGGLISKVSTPQGAEQVFGAIQNTDDSILDKLGDLLGGDDQSHMQQQGSEILDTVFGNQQSGIVGALSKALGLDNTLIGKLLAMVAPILMSVLGRHVKSKALDMVGFGNLLGAQKDHIVGYLPDGIGADLGLSNLASAGNAAADRAVSAAGDAAEAGGSLAKILIPLLVLGALAFVAFKMLGGGDNGAQEALQEEVPELNIDADLGIDEAVGALDFGDIDFGSLGEAGETLKGLQGKFTGIADGFKGLSDEAGAKSLVEKMEGLTDAVGDMGLGDLSGLAKTSASGMISKFTEFVRSMVDSMENTALKAIVQPAVDALLSKFESLSI